MYKMNTSFLLMLLLTFVLLFMTVLQESNEKYQKKCTARYVGALVADFHRNLIKGGVYFYPADQKAKQGKLRLLYECFPLAFLASGANGTAFSNLSPKTSILSLRAEEIHQRSPFFVFPLKNLVDLNEQ